MKKESRVHLDPKGFATRTCLKCNRQFSSTGPGNRICGKCQTVNRTTYAYGNHRVQHCKPMQVVQRRE